MIFNYLLFKVTTIVNIIIYYLFYSLFLCYLTLIFYYTIEEANGHTFHYDYTQYDYMWQVTWNLKLKQ